MFLTLIIIINISWAAANQHIKINEGSCDTKDWSNDAENSALHHRNKLCFKIYSNTATRLQISGWWWIDGYIQIEKNILNCNNISQYYCFYWIWIVQFDFWWCMLMNKAILIEVPVLGRTLQVCCLLEYKHTHTLDAFTSPPEPPLWLTVYPRVVTSSCYLKKTHKHTPSHWQKQEKAIWSQYLGDNTYTIIYTHTHHNRRWLHLYLRVRTWGKRLRTGLSCWWRSAASPVRSHRGSVEGSN